MNAFPDSNWLNIFKHNSATGVALTIFGVSTFLSARLGLFSLDALGRTGEAIFAVIGFIGIAHLCGRAVVWFERRRQRKRHEAEKARRFGRT